MTVGDLITMLRAYPNDDEIEIQVFETNSGELIDSTSAIGKKYPVNFNSLMLNLLSTIL